MLKRSLFTISLLVLIGNMAQARSLELFHSYSLSAHGGLQNTEFYNAGIQAMTLDGPGDSGFLMFHMGYGMDINYAHDGDSLHHLKIVPTVELLFFLLYVQAGIGTFVDLEDSNLWGLDLVCNFGLRVFLGDQYQAPSISAGGRMEFMHAKDYDEFVPSFMAMLSFYID